MKARPPIFKEASVVVNASSGRFYFEDLAEVNSSRETHLESIETLGEI